MVHHPFFCIRADRKPVWGNVSSVDMASIAIPRRPKSDGASRRARMMVLTKPRPRLLIRKVKTHIPPRTTFLKGIQVKFVRLVLFVPLVVGFTFSHGINASHLPLLIAPPASPIWAISSWLDKTSSVASISSFSFK